MEIKVDTIAEAHTKVCQVIFEDGIEIITEDGEITIEYDEPIQIIVRYPDLPNSNISKFNNFNNKALEEYKKQFLTINNNGFAYTYGNRMLDYPEFYNDEETFKEYIIGNGDGRGFNQIEWVINKLIEEPNTRRTVIVLRDPHIDCYSPNPPCLTLVQFMIRDKKLHLTAYFRSNDMLSAWCNNANGLLGLQIYVYNELISRTNEHIELDGIGSLTTISNSAHIYFKRDAEEMKRMRLEVYK